MNSKAFEVLFIIGAGLATLAVMPAGAQDSAVQQLQVNIQGILTIEISDPTYVQIVTPAEISTLNSLPLGAFKARSNQKNGYVITAVSQNNSALKNAAGDTIPYKLDILPFSGATKGGIGTRESDVVLSDTLPVLLYTSPTFAAQKCALNEGCSNDILLKLDNSLENVPEDIYTDQITYTIAPVL